MKKIAKMNHNVASLIKHTLGGAAVGGALVGGGRAVNEKYQGKKVKAKTIAKATATGALTGAFVGGTHRLARGPEATKTEVEKLTHFAKKHGFHGPGHGPGVGAAIGGTAGGLYGYGAQKSVNKTQKDKKKRGNPFVTGAIGAASGAHAGYTIGKLHQGLRVDQLRRLREGHGRNVGWQRARTQENRAKAKAWHERQKARAEQDAEWHAGYEARQKARDEEWAKTKAKWKQDADEADARHRQRAEEAKERQRKYEEGRRRYEESRRGSSGDSGGYRYRYGGGSDRGSGGDFSNRGQSPVPAWLKDAKTKAEAKKRWRAKAAEHHPDRGGDKEKFQKHEKEWSDFEKHHLHKLAFPFFKELYRIFTGA